MAAFNFELRYRLGKSNRNADALSRQYPSEGEGIGGLIPGTVVPAPLQQALEGQVAVEVQQAMIFTVPGYSLEDLRSLQAADPVSSEVLPFWRWKVRLGREVRQRMSPAALTLLRQWDRLVDKDGLIYQQVYCPNGREEVLQLLLQVALRLEVFNLLHQQHGHQGIERTTELIRRLCY